MNANSIRTFQTKLGAIYHLRNLCANRADAAMVEGPEDNQFTVMPVRDAEEFGFYTTATRKGNLCTVTIKG